MRRITASFCLLAALAVLAAPAQEKGEDWLTLSGQVVADTVSSDAFLLRNLVLAERRRPNRPPLSSAATTLEEAANQAFFSNRHNEAVRYLARLLVVLRGDTPGEWLDVAGALRFQLDRRIAAPGAIVHASLAPQLISTGPLAQSCVVKVAVVDVTGKTVLSVPPVTLEQIEDRDIRIATRGLADGSYAVRYALHDHAGKLIAGADRPLMVDSKLPARLQALEKQADELAAAGVAGKSARHAAAVETVLFVAGLYRRALSHPVASFHQNLHPLVLTLAGDWPPVDSTDPIVPERDLGFAEALAAGLLKGADPLAAKTGDLRLAYRSGVEQPYQPYRLYLPPNYDASRRWPLILALRSDTGDEGSLFDRCPPGQESLLLKLAREHGYVVVAPEGLGAYSYFYGSAADDAFRVVEAARSIASIDDAKIFVAGNSMGGMGAITLMLDGRTRFAGGAAVGASPLLRYEYARAPDKPLLVLQPGASPILSTREARVFGFLLAKYFKQLDYDELAGVDHFAAFPAALPRMIEYFDRVRDGTWKPSGKPIPLPEESRKPSGM